MVEAGREVFWTPLDKGFGENVDSRLNLEVEKMWGICVFSLTYVAYERMLFVKKGDGHDKIISDSRF